MSHEEMLSKYNTRLRNKVVVLRSECTRLRRFMNLWQKEFVERQKLKILYENQQEVIEKLIKGNK